MESRWQLSLADHLQFQEAARWRLISGGNVDSLLLDRIIAAGLRKQGRLIRFSVCLDNVPGSLARLLELPAKHQANVVHMHHVRNELTIIRTRVDLELETRGFEHMKEIEEDLKKANYDFVIR